MRVKKVNRYYCEFCKKASCAGGHMKKHETHCTGNPNRVCRMCLMIDAETKPIADRLALLPKLSDFPMVEGEFGGVEYDPRFVDEANAALPLLRELVGECPMCILASLKQAGIPCHVLENFDWKKETTSIRDGFYRQQQDEEEEGYAYI